MTDHTRRGLLRGAGALFLCAPAIVRATSLDAIRGVPMGTDLTETELLARMTECYARAYQNALLMRDHIEHNIYHGNPVALGWLDHVASGHHS